MENSISVWLCKQGILDVYYTREPSLRKVTRDSYVEGSRKIIRSYGMIT